MVAKKTRSKQNGKPTRGVADETDGRWRITRHCAGHMEINAYTREDGERSTYAQVIAYNVELFDWRERAAEPTEDYMPVDDDRMTF